MRLVHGPVVRHPPRVLRSEASAGNGVSTASADGGAISLGAINSGGNAIGVGAAVASPGIVPICCDPPYKPVTVYPAPVYPDRPKSAPVTPSGKVVVVTPLPDTGIGTTAGIAATSATLLALTRATTSLTPRRHPT